MFTKQHYEAIADIVSEIEDFVDRQRTCERLIYLFRSDNWQFSPAFFRHASKVEWIEPIFRAKRYYWSDAFLTQKEMETKCFE